MGKQVTGQAPGWEWGFSSALLKSTVHACRRKESSPSVAGRLHSTACRVFTRAQNDRLKDECRVHLYAYKK